MNRGALSVALSPVKNSLSERRLHGLEARSDRAPRLRHRPGKAFFEKAGFRLDVDYTARDDFRVVHLTPPGSECSIIFGKGMTDIPAGAFQGLYLIVSDINEAHAELAARGIDVSEIFHDEGGLLHHGHGGGRCVHDGEGQRRITGMHPERASYGSYLTFSDPDGNGWVLQEVKKRFPGR